MWSLQQKSAGNLLTLGPDAGGRKDASQSTPGNSSTGSDVAVALLLVEPHIQPPMTDRFAAQASRMKVESIVIRKLRSWISDPSLSRLWLYGKNCSSVSAIVFDAARKRHRPAVAYPCQHFNHGRNLNTEKDILVGLVYSFIYQLLQHLPQESIPEDWISKEKLATLDGTFNSVSQTIMPIEILYKAVPHWVYIIDGLQALGHSKYPEIKENLGILLP